MNTSLDKLRNLVGMENIAAQFEQYLLAMRMSRNKGMPCRGHMALMGNPGTGKTTAARLFCEILHEEGLLSKGQFISVTPCELIGQYIGETSAKTKAVCENAIGGVLCIDEAHGLMARFGDGYDYAHEAIAVLIEFMTSTDANDTIVMFAGYKDETENFLKNANPGLKSRVPWVFVFEDYTNDELTKLFQTRLVAEHMAAGEDALACAMAYFASLPRNKSFGNAREVGVLLSKVKAKQFRRLQETTKPTEEDLSTILPQDFPMLEQNSISLGKTESNRCNPKEIKDEIVQIVNELLFGLQKLQSKLNELCDE